MRIALIVVVLASCRRDAPAIDDAVPIVDSAFDAATADGQIIDGAAIDAAIDAQRIDAPQDAYDPNDLGATGLCVDSACTAISPDAIAFQPRWQLWSDGAEKRRWMWLPPGTKINTSNIDYWQFPVGTKLWKEFTVNGIRVETRYATRTGTGIHDWTFSGYQWNAAQTHATARPGGAMNVLGTPHDIPSQATCRGCHFNNSTPVLGFSAYQLDYAAPSGFVDLDDAIAAGLVTVVPPGSSSPHLPLPGTATDQAALGYVHANCGHCHNSDSQVTSHPMFRIESSHVDTMPHTRLYESTVNVTAITPLDGATIIAKPHDPDNSVIIKRTTTTDLAKRMPALGVETVDPTGQQVLRAWINSL